MATRQQTLTLIETDPPLLTQTDPVRLGGCKPSDGIGGGLTSHGCRPSGRAVGVAGLAMLEPAGCVASKARSLPLLI
jgi:hypothetical protein